MVDQPRVIEQLLAEQRFAAGDPTAIAAADLTGRRAALFTDLHANLRPVTVRWDAAGLSISTPKAGVVKARGVPRHVAIILVNETTQPLEMRLAVEAMTEANDAAGGTRQLQPWIMPPGQSQWSVIELTSDDPAPRLRVMKAQEAREVTLPVTLVAPAVLRGRLLDGDRNEPTPARVWVLAGDGEYRRGGPWADQVTFREKPLLEATGGKTVALPFFYADGTFELRLSPGRTTVTLERGFEHPLVTEEVVLTPGDTRDITLSSRRFIDMKSQGWISGDTHIHWVTNAWNVDLPLELLPIVQRAEDLRVANNLTLLHRTATDAFVKPSQAPMGPVAKFSDGEYHLEMGEEYRNQNLYGHLCFLNLRRLVLPIGTGPQIAGDDSLDYPLNKPAILQAREQGGVSIEAHGTGANHELPVNAVHGLTDSIDQLDPDDYYRLLDCGFQLPLSNGSDHPARVVGCARAYVHVDGPFSYERWIDGIRRGRTFTTSGPLLLLTVNGRPPGEVLTPLPTERLEVVVRASSRKPLGRVQLVSNGTVLRELITQDREATLTLELPATESRWIVARCSAGETWNAIRGPDIAHTSAVYVHTEHRPVFREAAMRDWLERLAAHRRDILFKGRFGNARQRAEAVAYVDEAAARFERLAAWATNTTDTLEETRERLRFLAGFVTPEAHESEWHAALTAAPSYRGLAEAVEPWTLLRIHVNPESRVKLAVVTPPARLTPDRTERFLVEVHNQAGIQAPLRLTAYDLAAPPGTTANWCAIEFVEQLGSAALLSGAEYEWKLVRVRCDAEGQREVRLVADAGQGTQDLGFRAQADLLLDARRMDHRGD
jgi:hypothetical protein